MISVQSQFGKYYVAIMLKAFWKVFLYLYILFNENRLSYTTMGLYFKKNK